MKRERQANHLTDRHETAMLIIGKFKINTSKLPEDDKRRYDAWKMKAAFGVPNTNEM